VFPHLPDQLRAAANLRQILRPFFPGEANSRFDARWRLTRHTAEPLPITDATGRIARRSGHRCLVTPGRIYTVLTGRVRHGPQVLGAGIILHDGAGIHDVAAVAGHLVNDSPAKGAYLVRVPEAKHDVRNAAAEGKLVVQLAVDMEDVVLVTMENDA